MPFAAHYLNMLRVESNNDSPKPITMECHLTETTVIWDPAPHLHLHSEASFAKKAQSKTSGGRDVICLLQLEDIQRGRDVTWMCFAGIQCHLRLEQSSLDQNHENDAKHDFNELKHGVPGEQQPQL
eukprot:TRINITY_DN356_c0_g1_i3.p1 TRINITY_DN356_c0_g1~~TRINITY_DN356_c0_g1_i3.p1  ORF type:complete len:126 (+),score=0.31 TRINITY_DN356_c0_g1_i3:95-472(+)